MDRSSRQVTPGLPSRCNEGSPGPAWRRRGGIDATAEIVAVGEASRGLDQIGAESICLPRSGDSPQTQVVGDVSRYKMIYRESKQLPREHADRARTTGGPEVNGTARHGCEQGAICKVAVKGHMSACSPRCL